MIPEHLFYYVAGTVGKGADDPSFRSNGVVVMPVITAKSGAGGSFTYTVDGASAGLTVPTLLCNSLKSVVTAYSSDAVIAPSLKAVIVR